MESRSLEMKFIQLIYSRDKVPENYTGIIDYWYPHSSEEEHHNSGHKFRYTRVFAINGIQRKLRDRWGKVTFYVQNRPSTFEEMFDSLDEVGKEIIVWNLDMWR